jgi:hypothetical protein
VLTPVARSALFFVKVEEENCELECGWRFTELLDRFVNTLVEVEFWGMFQQRESLELIMMGLISALKSFRFLNTSLIQTF